MYCANPGENSTLHRHDEPARALANETFLTRPQRLSAAPALRTAAHYVWRSDQSCGEPPHPVRPQSSQDLSSPCHTPPY